MSVKGEAKPLSYDHKPQNQSPCHLPPLTRSIVLTLVQRSELASSTPGDTSSLGV